MFTLPADRQSPPSVMTLAPESAFGAADALVADRSMLASPFFWLGGVASILVWTGIALAVLRFA